MRVPRTGDRTLTDAPARSLAAAGARQVAIGFAAALLVGGGYLLLSGGAPSAPPRRDRSPKSAERRAATKTRAKAPAAPAATKTSAPSSAAPAKPPAAALHAADPAVSAAPPAAGAQAGGEAPSVTLLSPAAALTVDENTSVRFRVRVTDPDGDLDRVEYHVAGRLVGVVKTKPYAFVWKAAALGAHAVTAKAFDRAGHAAATEDVALTVRSRNVSGIAVWHSHRTSLRTDRPGATVPDEKGNFPASLTFFQAKGEASLTSGPPLTTYTTDPHPESFNTLSARWCDGPYPYVGLSSVPRGEAEGETNAPTPAGVTDLIVHPPSQNALVVVAFVAPVAGTYVVGGLGARRLIEEGETSTLKVFGPRGGRIANLTARNDCAWTRESKTWEFADLAAGERIHFAVDPDGDFGWEATQIAWSVALQELSRAPGVWVEAESGTISRGAIQIDANASGGKSVQVASVQAVLTVNLTLHEPVAGATVLIRGMTAGWRDGHELYLEGPGGKRQVGGKLTLPGGGGYLRMDAGDLAPGAYQITFKRNASGRPGGAVDVIGVVGAKWLRVWEPPREIVDGRLKGIVLMDDATARAAAAPRPAPAAAAAPALVYLRNGEMSAGDPAPQHWAVTWRPAGRIEITRDTGDFKEGPSSLRVTYTGADAQGGIYQKMQAVPSGPYTVSGFAKAAGKFKWAEVAVQIFDANWNLLKHEILLVIPPSDTWTAFSTTVEPVPRGVNIHVGLNIGGEGRVWLDEVKVAVDSARPAAGAEPPRPIRLGGAVLKRLAAAYDGKKVRPKLVAAAGGVVVSASPFSQLLRRKYLPVNRGYRLSTWWSVRTFAALKAAAARNMRMHKPEVVRICLVPPDLLRGQGVPDLEDDLTAAIDLILEGGGVPVLFTAPVRRDADAPYHDAMRMFNEKLIEIARDRKIPCLDADLILNGPEDRDKHFTARGAPSPAGYDAMNEKFIELYRRLERDVFGRTEK